MKAFELSALLAPFSTIVNRHAMSDTYRTLEIGKDYIYACAPWGTLEVDAELGNTKPFWVDGERFIGVIKGMPNEEVVLKLGNNLIITAGDDADRVVLPIFGKLDLPKRLDWNPFLKEPSDLPKGWEGKAVEGLQLGSLACGPQSMMSAGVYGTAFDFDDGGLMLSSSDSITMATAYVAGFTHPDWPDKLALVPEAMVALAAVLKQKGAHNKIEFKSDLVQVNAGPFYLALKPAPLLKTDILQICARFPSREASTKIPTKEVESFITRIGILSEAKQHAYVVLRISPTKLTLEFEEGAASSERRIDVEAQNVTEDLPPIKLDAFRMARALAHAGQIGFEYIEQGTLIFWSNDFSYFVCGIRDGKEE